MLGALHHLMRPGSHRRRRPSHWRPPLEALEGRAVPAGDVTAGMFGTTLFLTGDELDNIVQFHPGDQPGEVVVHGVNTTVNGSNQPATFTGVQAIEADLRGGDDWARATDFTLTGTTFPHLLLDGGAGDDRLELINTTIHVTGTPNNGAFVEVYGERLLTSRSSSTGNDAIRLQGTTVVADGAFDNNSLVYIYGEDNEGGEVTGGNDTITVADTVITAANGFSPNLGAALTIFGDYNLAFGTTSTIGAGNDTITVRNTTISAAGGSSADSATVNVFGDFGAAIGLGGTSASTIGGGNDTILIDGTTISATGPAGFNSSAVNVIGDYSEVFGAPSGTTTSTIAGGNDVITISNTDVAATGATVANLAFLDITGDYSHVAYAPPGGTAATTIGGGNDTIAVTNVTLTVAGAGGYNLTVLSVTGENTLDQTSFAPGTVGQGNDVVTLSNVHVTSDLTAPFAVLAVDTGQGDDQVAVLDSSFGLFFGSFGDGDDTVTFDNNTFDSATLDGGPGYDRLAAAANTGVLVSLNFEEETITP